MAGSTAEYENGSLVIKIDEREDHLEENIRAEREDHLGESMRTEREDERKDHLEENIRAEREDHLGESMRTEREDERKDHLEEIIEIVSVDHSEESRYEHLIQKVPLTLKQVIRNSTYVFVPKVVSLGPYHHHRKGRTMQMDYLKKDAVRWFVSLFPRHTSNDEVIRKIYENFEIAASSNKPLRDWYAADETINGLKDEDINYMMFLDGCFILYIINLFANKPEDRRKTHVHHSIFIVSDMFLLENQIPYKVIESLLSLMPHPKALKDEHIEQFLKKFLLEHDTLPSNSDTKPLHLLDLLRTKLIGSNSVNTNHDCDAYQFRSITELKAKGIKICKSDSRNLSKIEFKKGLYACLSLPRMIIDQRTRTLLLNLIAYETCPRFFANSDRIITSYVCFLDSLIDHADDVKELRSKGILPNSLGSDSKVANLFNEMGIFLMLDPDPGIYKVYADTLKDIEAHCNEPKTVVQVKRWLDEMLSTHFRSPWTIISLLAFILLLFLTAIQTYFTVW